MTTPHLELEQSLIAAGVDLVVGMDEVGRGAIAGPVWVSAGVWTQECGPIPEGIRDSKLISEKKRPEIAERATAWLSAHASGSVDAEQIDSEGIMWALGQAGSEAIRQLWPVLSVARSPVIVLDGNQDWLTQHLPVSIRVITQTKADATAGSVAAASVIAKVGRDQVMISADGLYPGYGFAGHKGYGSAAHREAISRLGPSPVHRRTWIH